MRVGDATRRAAVRRVSVTAQRDQGAVAEFVAAAQLRQVVGQGLVEIPRVGSVRASGLAVLPSLVVDGRGAEVAPVSVFLRDLMLCDMSPATCRSYAHDCATQRVPPPHLEKQSPRRP
jgi:hypothetical protein